MSGGPQHRCADCHADTWELGEMYMVHDDIWDTHVGQVWLLYDAEGVCIDRVGPGTVMLCIGCLERRMGRQLTPEDFTDAPINFPYAMGTSSRLLHRLGATQQKGTHHE